MDMFQEAQRAIREETERLRRENPGMDSREAKRRAERDNMFIKGVMAAALTVLGTGAWAGIEIGVGAAVGGTV